MEGKSVIILGAQGMGKVALDIFNQGNVVTYCFLDDNQELHNTEVEGVMVLGSTEDETLLKYIDHECNVFIANDDMSYKKSLVEMLQQEWKVMPINAIHPLAKVSDLAFIGYGNFINAGVYVNAGAKVNNHTLIHSNSLIDFDSVIEDYVQIGAGSTISSAVVIGEGAFIGSGATIVSGVKIGAGARVGAGSVVIENVPEGATVFGNPAKKM